MAYKKDEIELMFETICKKVESGKPLRQILKEENMPSTKTFFEWVDEDSKKVKRYVRACEIRADIIFDEMIEIADDQEDDIIIGEGGKEYVNHNVINRARLRVDTRKWILSKMNPKKYADKIDITTDNQKLTGATGLEGLTFEQLLELENAKRKK